MLKKILLCTIGFGLSASSQAADTLFGQQLHVLCAAQTQADVVNVLEHAKNHFAEQCDRQTDLRATARGHEFLERVEQWEDALCAREFLRCHHAIVQKSNHAPDLDVCNTWVTGIKDQNDRSLLVKLAQLAHEASNRVSQAS